MILRSITFTCSSRESVLVRLCCTALPMRDIKPKSRHARPSHFVDWKRVKVIGGPGGDGCISFMKLFCNPNAGPDGGDGGNGGHVIFEASSNVKSLEHVSSTIFGNAGLRGFGRDMHGRCGEHTVIPVPLGTVVCNEKESPLADLDSEGSRFLAARGGAGGRGNHHFLTNENRHPRVCQLGAQGEAIVYHLEMKTMAQAGLIGFPNVGKSTLLRAISRARPKVAAYPFTTLRPHVGVVTYDDYLQLAVADLPGLVEGAHKNRGLGHAFLRHTERCGCLLFVIDLQCPDPASQYTVLLSELELYRQGFTDGAHAVIANKIDLPGALDHLECLRKEIGGRYPLFPVSAKYGTNLLDVLKYVRSAYDATTQQKC
uniref:Putative mitochondrial ribosome-associated gtpase 2 n=1 Tax=Hyalomma excavatum TaxID=257692 RepID=A0A131XEY4_9ACAR